MKNPRFLYYIRPSGRGTWEVYDVLDGHAVDHAKTKSAAIQKLVRWRFRRPPTLEQSAELARRSHVANYWVPNPATGGRKPVELITDRAKRYRANSPDNRPAGPRRCVICGSRKHVGVMHLDGDESHGERRNLAWGCAEFSD